MTDARIDKAAAARRKWAKGFKPYHDALRKLKLPAAGPRNSAVNIERLLAVTNCMHWVKVREDAKRAARKKGKRID